MDMMVRLIAVCLLVVSSATALHAGTIYDIRTGAISDGAVVEVDGLVVTAVQKSSFTVTELPAGPYTAIWVYQGSTPSVRVGDVVTVKGYVRDHAGRSEINMLYPSDAGAKSTDTTTPPALFVDTTDLLADSEAWESHVVTITDGMIVQEIQDGGFWLADSYETGLPILFDDYFYDYATVELGECYNNAYGMLTWYKDRRVFKVLSVAHVDCTVPNGEVGFGDLKAMFR
jgi:primosomal replication protein N